MKKNVDQAASKQEHFGGNLMEKGPATGVSKKAPPLDLKAGADTTKNMSHGIEDPAICDYSQDVLAQRMAPHSLGHGWAAMHVPNVGRYSHVDDLGHDRYSITYEGGPGMNVNVRSFLGSRILSQRRSGSQLRFIVDLRQTDGWGGWELYITDVNSVDYSELFREEMTSCQNYIFSRGTHLGR